MGGVSILIALQELRERGKTQVRSDELHQRRLRSGHLRILRQIHHDSQRQSTKAMHYLR
jgi:hypothetical protein